MKVFNSFVILTFWLLACSKDAAKTDSSNVYNDTMGTMVNLANSEWYLLRVNQGGTVNLKASGSTNADRLTIMTWGDGLLTEVYVALDARQNFNLDIGISFSAMSVQSGEFETGTQLKA